MNLLGAITLTQGYTLPTVSSTNLSNLNNWTVILGTLNSQSSSNLNVDTVILKADVQYSGLTPVTIQYGINFRITVTIDTSVAGTVRVVPYNSGTALPSASWSAFTAIATGSHTYNLDFASGGYTFDTIRLIIRGASGATVDFSSVSISGTDVSNYATFDTGDRVLVYWDGSAFVVQREDNPGGALTTITSGPNLGQIDASQLTGASFPRDPIPGQRNSDATSFYQECSGNDLYTFNLSANAPDFPYFYSVIHLNNAACSTTTGGGGTGGGGGTTGGSGGVGGGGTPPIVCDVAFYGLPDITPATNDFSNDGQVTITAAGSHGAVRYSKGYSPGSPAGEYANLTNATGNFTGLSPGIYRFYAVDQYNCYASIDVVVTSAESTTFGAKYRLQYYDVHNDAQTVVDISERGFTGDPLYVEMSSSPFTLSKNQNALNDKFDTIRPTFAEVQLNSAKHFQYLGLFSQDDRKFKVSFTHGTSSWVGYLAASTYREEYAAARNYPVTLSAGDGLETLKDYPFVDASGNNIFTDLSLLEIICLILKKLDLGINIISGLNKFATGMTTASTDDPLPQTYIDCEAFYDTAPMTCDVVLDAILKTFGAFIIQKDSKWHIIEADSQTSPYAYREFDADGTYVTHGTISPELEISTPSVNLEHVLFADNNHTLEITPAYGKIVIKYKLKPRASIFPASLDEWQVNSFSGGYGTAYGIEGTVNKGMEFFNFGTGFTTFTSPFFNVTSSHDSVSISAKYLVNLVRYATFTDPSSGITFNPNNISSPPWIRVNWRLIMTYASADYYFHETIGWNRADSIATSSTSVATPTSHPTSKSLTINTGLSLSPGTVIKIVNASASFRAIVTTYDTSTGALVCSSYSNEGTGTYTSWTIYAAGPDFQDNYYFIDQFNTDFQTFEKTVDLPDFTTASSISLRLMLTLQGPNYKDFNGSTTLKSIAASTLPAGFQIRGTDPANAFYLRWYKLREGTDAESSPDIIRPNDFNSTSNAVVWDSAGYEAFKYVNDVRSIKVQELLVKFLPGRVKPIEEETITLTNNVNYKENLDYELIVGSLPVDLYVIPEVYTNILKMSDGTATVGWSRSGFTESTSAQRLLMKSLGNQYAKPSWRLGGSWLGPDISFISIIKHTIASTGFSMTNPENPNGTGWSQSGSGQTWVGTTGHCTVDFDATHTGNSLYVRQSCDIIVGSRLRIDYRVTRSLTSGSRTDRFVCVLFSGATVVQKITLADGISSDNDIINSAIFTVDTDSTFIGFYVENISGTGTCEYQVDYFRGDGISSVRYYYLNKVSRNDKHNLYSAEMVQLIPASASADQSIDDTGGGNTNAFNPGGQYGNAFNSGSSNGFGF